MAKKGDRTLISFYWALKSILRQKDNFDILEGFLSDLLKEKIKITGLLESESNQDGKKDKFNRVDLKAKDSADKEIIIEVQHDPEPDYLERVYYGTSKSLVDDMKSGYRYKKVKKIISVSIVYWQLLEKSYIVKGSMKFEDLTQNREMEVKEAKDIFADYYFIQPEWFDDKIKTAIDEWVYLFKYSKVKGDIKATNIDSVSEKLDRLKMSDEERIAYDEYQFNKTINEGVLQVREDKGKNKMIEAMKKGGMSKEEIERIVKLSEEESSGNARTQ